MLRADRRRGYTIVELLIVIAIIAILLSLGVWVLQKFRENANRTVCIANMRSIALAVLQFHDANDRFPTYNGIYPVPTSGPSTGDTSQSGNKNAVYGSYLVHLLPQLGGGPEYKAIVDDVLKYTNTGKPIKSDPATPGTPGVPGVLKTKGTPGVSAQYDYTGLTYVPGTSGTPATYNEWNAKKVIVGYSNVASPTSQNGAVVWVATPIYSPAQYPDPGTPISGTSAYYVNSAGVRVNPPLISPGVAGTPDIYDPVAIPAGPSTPGRNYYASTFALERRGFVHPAFLCPSDPSPGTDPNAPAAGKVYPTSGGADYWASTNYVANWNTFSAPIVKLGYKSPPQSKASINDGLTCTIMLAEAYAWCDGKGRTAFVSWHENDAASLAAGSTVPNGGMTVGGVHNFGITYGMKGNQIQTGGRPVVGVVAENGLPNPIVPPNSGTSNELIFEFQVQPRTYDYAHCPAGADCCNNMTVQSGHPAGLNVALCDGSVKTLRGDINLDTWRCLMLPNDGKAIKAEW